MILTNRQSRAIIKELCRDKVTERQQKLAIRNVTMSLLMLDAGLRTTEVVNLTQGDLFIGDKSLGELMVIRGLPQGHPRRIVPLCERIRFCIEQMNSMWWKQDADKPGNFAFYDESPLKHITTAQLRRIISQAGMNALNLPIRPTLLRKTFAARLYKETDLQTVQRILDYKTSQDSYYY